MSVEIPPDGLNWTTLKKRFREALGDEAQIFNAIWLEVWTMASVDLEPYVDGSGQLIWVHLPNKTCQEGCAIHNPTDHVMRDFPTHWRNDRGLMERICPHGVGHPDPDHIAFVRKVNGKQAAIVEAVHGCDGCCTRKYDC